MNGFKACLALLALTLPLKAVTLAWDPSIGATGYKLYYGTQSSNYASVVVAGINTSNKISTLTPGVRYYFAVTAYNATSESAPSAEISFVPSLQAPLNLRILPEIITLEIQNGPMIFAPWAPLTNQQFFRGLMIGPD